MKMIKVNNYYNFIWIGFFSILFFKVDAMENTVDSLNLEDNNINEIALISESTNITSNNLDELIIKAIKNIKENGEVIKDNPKPCQQAYSVHYTLLNPLNRIHNLRSPIAKRYFCKELLAFFNGSLNINDGLAEASKVWAGIADENDDIVSNYGYYVFHEKLLQAPNISQYDWVIYHLSKNLDTRKGLINISQSYHKKVGVKDYPCTLGLQFFVKKNYLCCLVSSRSTDVYWGLPYNMGFFSFLTELVYKDLKQRLGSEQTKDLKLGYVTMKTSFTQIYDKTRKQALNFFENFKDYKEKYQSDMPEIDDAQETLKDIYNGTQNTAVMKWIYKNAQS